MNPQGFIDKVEVIVGVTTHGSNLNLARCLDSIASQKSVSNLGVVILIDKIGPAVSIAGIQIRWKIIYGYYKPICGSSARSKLNH